ncbi:type I-E CRISPR-associated protein Cas6/Cse3/CasE [Psychromonas sp. MB-3u-54]|uniref:type I-E CRISPR-associated protein Cas6/Cse3/CasE n=1 Tax=Psychromonas sp. MB-3u-54 TaxID=2058319 RepID=UPI000C31BD51|nr:type I-E CRISPR-associated protein Cas6/Cse3/CasE [Psychromonas sp. MB-3u-54]PKH02941.1 type I-E CRISPR-associated protein Cas6/Cse3/CasE [Psychromonas sp. MB-3u-54]
MYLSQVMLNTHDTYEQHQAIWSLFANVADRKRDHLFRVEVADRQSCKVLLQSSTEPKSSEQAKVLASKSFLAEIKQDAFYKFKLLAYPTKCLSQGKKVIEIKEPDEQVEWLQRKLSGANATVTAMDNVMVRSKKSYNSRFVCFEGILQVTDSEQIQRALVMGIGRKKHAGAGLLSLARTQ